MIERPYVYEKTFASDRDAAETIKDIEQIKSEFHLGFSVRLTGSTLRVMVAPKDAEEVVLKPRGKDRLSLDSYLQGTCGLTLRLPLPVRENAHYRELQFVGKFATLAETDKGMQHLQETISQEGADALCAPRGHQKIIYVGMPADEKHRSPGLMKYLREQRFEPINIKGVDYVGAGQKKSL